MSSSAAESALKVTVVGKARGSLGSSVLKHLIASNYDVTVLTRDRARAAESLPSGIKIEQVDYSSVESIIPHVRGQDAVVILISKNDSEIQIRIIDAVIAAKVPHLVPSSFSVPTSDPAAFVAPCFAHKVKMHDYVFRKSKEGVLTYTSINQGVLFDLVLSIGHFINVKGGPFQLYDGGNFPISFTTLDTIGRAVALCLKMPEKVANRVLCIHDVGVSQNRLMELASELDPSKKWNPIPTDTTELDRKSWEAYNNGDSSLSNMRGFYPKASFGGNQAGVFKKVDNALLGLEVKGDEFVKDVLSRFM